MDTSFLRKKVILDACCGGRCFWFNKQHERALFVDIRSEKFAFEGNRTHEVSPDSIVDFRNMPYPELSFKLVVFDPPHLVHAGNNGYMSKKYGSLKNDWREYIRAGFKECWRVLDVYGVLIFKWNETDIKVSTILDLIGKEPLFGHKSGKASKTHWLCFMKFEYEVDE